MDTIRIRVKIGAHEFDAEGPAEIVQSQFESFKKIIEGSSASSNNTIAKQTQPQDESAKASASDLDGICSVDGRIVSLTVKPDSEAVAALLIILGQKVYRDNDTATASELKDGLERSGYRPGRIDRLMQPLIDEGSVIKVGARKGTRYRFTNPGLGKAKRLAEEAAENVA